MIFSHSDMVFKRNLENKDKKLFDKNNFDIFGKYYLHNMIFLNF